MFPTVFCFHGSVYYWFVFHLFDLKRNIVYFVTCFFVFVFFQCLDSLFAACIAECIPFHLCNIISIKLQFYEVKIHYRQPHKGLFL